MQTLPQSSTRGKQFHVKCSEAVKTVWRVLGAEALEFKMKTKETRSILYSAIHRQHFEKVI